MHVPAVCLFSLCYITQPILSKYFTNISLKKKKISDGYLCRIPYTYWYKQRFTHIVNVQLTIYMCSSLYTCAVQNKHVQFTIYMYSSLYTCTVHNIHVLFTTYLYSSLYTCTVHNIPVQFTIYIYSSLYTCTVYNIHVQFTIYMYS